MWGKSADGHASDKTLTTPRFAALAQMLARPGVAPGASLDRADAALVTEDKLAVRGDTLCSTRLPATSSAWGRLSAAAVADKPWAAGGRRAQTPPTTHRPGPCDTVAERRVTFEGKA